jgi:hypothetical protein
VVQIVITRFYKGLMMAEKELLASLVRNISRFKIIL